MGAEGPVVREEEVGHAAAEDGEHVGGKNGKTGGVDEEGHEHEVSQERDEAVGEVKAQELWDGWRSGAVGPGVAEVPTEVVQDGELDRSAGGEQKVSGKEAVEHGERRELDGDAECADEVVANEAGQRGQRGQRVSGVRGFGGFSGVSGFSGVGRFSEE